MGRRCLADGEFIQLQSAFSSAELRSGHSMTLLDNRLPLTFDHLEPPLTACPPFAPSVASSRPRWHDFYWGTAFLNRPNCEKPAIYRLHTALNREVSILQNNATASPSCSSTNNFTITKHTRRDSKNGQVRRRPWEPPGSNILFSPDFVSMTIRNE